jgi:hypothetical protein
MQLSANPAARAALTYITVGALLDVWAGVWFWYMRDTQPADRGASWYLCTGLLLSGAVLMGIGFFVGRIGRQARSADAPPVPAGVAQESAVAQAAAANNQAAMQANAAGTPMVVAPMNTVPAGMPAAAPVVPATGLPKR